MARPDLKTTLAAPPARMVETVPAARPEIATTLPADDQPLETLNQQVTAESAGRYLAKTGGELGRGGLGRVLLAVDSHLGREVAVKELLPTGELPSVVVTPGNSVAALARFVREARVTAQLEHPNIVPVYELGRRADGTFYYVMKRVRGRTLAHALAHCDGVRQRLHLLDHFLDVCQAIAYAHARGVVHRDLKPQNVMVGEFGETVVLDWGLAKVKGRADVRGGELARTLRSMDDSGAALTLDGSLVGTPAYMSPEQAQGRIDDVDERSDVWSIGAMLFELLAGAPPITGETAWEVIRKLRTDTPPRVTEVEPAAPPELASIVTRALQRDPAARYASAGELVEDLQAFMAGTRVGAHAYSHGERVGRAAWNARGFLRAAGAAALAAAAAAAVAWAVVGASRDDAQRAAAGAEARAAESRADALVARASAAEERGEHDAAVLLAAAAVEAGAGLDARSVLLEAWQEPSVAQEWVYRSVGGCRAPTWSADGTTVTCASRAGAVVLDAGSGRETARYARSLPGMTAVALAGADVVVVDGTGARRWDPAKDAAGERVPVEHAPSAVAFVGGVLVAASGDTLWACAKECVELPGKPRAWAAARDVRRVATAGEGALMIVDVDGGRVLARAEVPRDVVAVALSDNGELVATGDANGTLSWWTTSPLRREVALAAHAGAVQYVAISRDGRFVATAGRDRTLAVWGVESGRLAARIAPVAASSRPDYSPGGTLVVDDGGARVRAFTLVRARAVKPEKPPTAAPADAAGTCVAAAVSPTGDRACAAADGAVSVARRTSAVVKLGSLAGRALSLAFSLDGRRLASASNEELRLWDVDSGGALAVLRRRGAGATVLHFGEGGLTLDVLVGGDARRLSLAPLIREPRAVAAEVGATSGLAVTGTRAAWRAE
ncbi:MAG: protein kinase [Deltaproteobacteria bacterium]|nr:protein kinase [Deltaproteobacteria bacterium]